VESCLGGVGDNEGGHIEGAAHDCSMFRHPLRQRRVLWSRQITQKDHTAIRTVHIDDLLCKSFTPRLVK
jgi:hypothetical protein